MAEKGAAKGWTDTEKVGLFLQIIARGGPVPWPDLTLPEGRTIKACQVMLDKEKQKIKKAREAAGEDLSALASPNKRKAADTNGGKSKKGRKSKTTDDAENDDDEEEITLMRLNKRGRKKKKAVKASADENVEELVKEEVLEDE